MRVGRHPSRYQNQMDPIFFVAVVFVVAVVPKPLAVRGRRKPRSARLGQDGVVLDGVVSVIARINANAYAILERVENANSI